MDGMDRMDRCEPWWMPMSDNDRFDRRPQCNVHLVHSVHTVHPENDRPKGLAPWQWHTGCFLKERMPGYENARIVETRPQIGVRQGRRVRGQYVFTIDDLTSSRHFDDGIARLGCHLPDCGGNYGIKGLAYDVPYRCLVPETMDGLLIGGRCVSCDYDSCNTLRLIVPCFAIGQASGAAAALAVREDAAPRNIAIDALRYALRAQDVCLDWKS
jgi:hypothetical protein